MPPKFKAGFHSQSTQELIAGITTKAHHHHSFKCKASMIQVQSKYDIAPFVQFSARILKSELRFSGIIEIFVCRIEQSV
jgi:hypothetical protein